MRARLAPVIRPVAFAVLALAATGATQAHAQDCANGTRLSASEISSLLTSRYACGSAGGETWTELHNGGVITDYKKGPSDPVDPTKNVGTYSIGGTAVGTVTYSYAGGGGTYSYEVRAPGASATTTTGTYSFCGATFGGRNLSITIATAPCAAP